MEETVITETHITDVIVGDRRGLAVSRDSEGGCFWSATDGEGDPDGWEPIPRYLYDAIMRHHREVGS